MLEPTHLLLFTQAGVILPVGWRVERAHRCYGVIETQRLHPSAVAQTDFQHALLYILAPGCNHGELGQDRRRRSPEARGEALHRLAAEKTGRQLPEVGIGPWLAVARRMDIDAFRRRQVHARHRW